MSITRKYMKALRSAYPAERFRTTRYKSIRIVQRFDTKHGTWDTIKPTHDISAYELYWLQCKKVSA